MTSPRFCISQITTSPWTLEKDVEVYARLGTGIELVESKLSLDDREAEWQLAMIKDSDLDVCSLQGRTLTVYPSASAAHPVDPAERTQQMKATIDRFSRYWPDLPLITNTGALPDSGNEAEVWQGCIRYYRELADYAADKGMRLAMEALGPSLMNRSTIFSTLGEAHELVEEIDRDNVGLCLDLYNSWQDAALLEAIIEAAEKLLVVHLADWKRPRSYHDRYTLGDGEIPLMELLLAIKETGYTGPYVLELFSEQVPDSLWQDNAVLEQALVRSKEGFEQAWATGDALANLSI